MYLKVYTGLDTVWWTIESIKCDSVSIMNTVEPLLFDPLGGVTIRSDNRMVR